MIKFMVYASKIVKLAVILTFAIKYSVVLIPSMKIMNFAPQNIPTVWYVSMYVHVMSNVT